MYRSFILAKLKISLGKCGGIVEKVGGIGNVKLRIENGDSPLLSDSLNIFLIGIEPFYSLMCIFIKNIHI